MSYGASLNGMNRLVADYVDRILKGASQPIYRSSSQANFELVVDA